ncbi:class I SAM-dependent methyltransferase [Luteibaculum oceani]|uniref:Class I SAM-dependent methyltransferase n=1 Tax=Luteibaculum oceani TaxID=1294296 RepID=A0A5C6VA08_9FLAO|nr:class I SAM-dependent methyltransferase [Luteibaculum oceani]TXC81660.1 class I SAM-dependent methyltransferase [Luteibaculum oceani]
MYSTEVFGKCIYDYHSGNKKAHVKVHAPDFDDDEIPGEYLLRNFPQMPDWEQLALEKCRGSVLDIGACAGGHSAWLQSKGLEVTALEIDPLACRFLNEERNISKVVNESIYDFQSKKKFDTILLLMNGLGIAGTTRNLSQFIFACLSNLNPGGQIIFESADVGYLFPDEELSLDPYYGEMEYQVSFEKDISEPFPWLYLDSKNMKLFCDKHLLAFDVLYQGENNNYLGVISNSER